jgi:hypothetical protein
MDDDDWTAERSDGVNWERIPGGPGTRAEAVRTAMNARGSGISVRARWLSDGRILSESDMERELTSGPRLERSRETSTRAETTRTRGTRRERDR